MLAGCRHFARRAFGNCSGPGTKITSIPQRAELHAEYGAGRETGRSDALTGNSGRARLGMADGSTLVVRPDSTIIVRDNASTDDGKKTNVHVVVDSGQMYVRTEQQPAGTNNVVETPKTKNKVGGQTNASFGVNPEGTEEIRVNSGNVQTTDTRGQQTALTGGQYVAVNPSGTLSRPQRLLEPYLECEVSPLP